MNTFLPYANFRSSAFALDQKRLNKQVSECKHIAAALAGETKGYAFHPATLMWEGYLPALIEYARWCCYAFYRMRKKQHKYESWFEQKHTELLHARTLEDRRNNPDTMMPWWLGNPKFHASNRGILLHKNPAWYKKQFKGMRVPANKPDYVWPVHAARWKIENRKLFVLKSKWKKTGLRADSTTRLTSRKLVGSNTARYLLQKGGEVIGK